MGLDVNTVEHLSAVLQRLADSSSPRIVLSLRSDEHIPSWLTRMILLLDNHQVHNVKTLGEMVTTLNNVKNELLAKSEGKTADKSSPGLSDLEYKLLDDTRNLSDTLNPSWWHEYNKIYRLERARKLLQAGKNLHGNSVQSRDGFPVLDTFSILKGEPVIQMEGVKVAYGDKVVLGNFRQEDAASDGFWWTVRRGERWGVFGANGNYPQSSAAQICLTNHV